jgi:hypothetical protein
LDQARENRLDFTVGAGKARPAPPQRSTENSCRRPIGEFRGENGSPLSPPVARRETYNLGKSKSFR